MRVVNLARRPFVNRRPVVRLAVLLWVIGAILLAVNVRLYRDHWRGSAANRQQLAEAERALDERRQILDRQSAQLSRIDLGEQNERIAFLNTLIGYRTFPWSALFDDLERVLPAQVELLNVQPALRLAEEAELEALRSRVESQRRTSGRRAARRGGTTGRADAQEGASAAEAPRQEPDLLAADEVALRLNGFAESEDALMELVDRLFANPSFRRPLLDNESLGREPGQRGTRFNLGVVYLTHGPAGPAEEADREPPEPEHIEVPAADDPPPVEPAAVEAPLFRSPDASAAPGVESRSGAHRPALPDRTAPPGPPRFALGGRSPIEGAGT